MVQVGEADEQPSDQHNSLAALTGSQPYRRQKEREAWLSSRPRQLNPHSQQAPFYQVPTAFCPSSGEKPWGGKGKKQYSSATGRTHDFQGSFQKREVGFLLPPPNKKSSILKTGGGNRRFVPLLPFSHGYAGNDAARQSRHQHSANQAHGSPHAASPGRAPLQRRRRAKPRLAQHRRAAPGASRLCP